MRALAESGTGSLAEFGAGVGKTPQIIASAYVGRGPRLEKAELERLVAWALEQDPGILRFNLRYSGTEPQIRAMLESDGSLGEAELARVAVGVCRRAQEFAGVGRAEIDILNTTHGGVLPVDGG